MDMTIIYIVLIVLLLGILWHIFYHLTVIFHKDTTDHCVKIVMKDPYKYVMDEEMCYLIRNMIYLFFVCILLFAACNGKYATCGGFQWKFKNSNKVISNVDTKVIQYNKKGEILALYKNAKEASLASKVSHSSISNCLNGLSKSAGGFVWKKEICK